MKLLLIDVSELLKVKVSQAVSIDLNILVNSRRSSFNNCEINELSIPECGLKSNS
jgi:hypothetical protein